MKEEDTTTNNNHTTNAYDQAEAKRIKEYLAEQSSKQSTEKDTSSSSSKDSLDTYVFIDEGANKYVLISAVGTTTEKFVVSQRGAPYHRNVAESFLPMLEERGYTNIQIQGGGRISLHSTEQKIHVYGYSYGFGQANHEEATDIIRNDSRYLQYQITWSNDGY